MRYIQLFTILTIILALFSAPFLSAMEEDKLVYVLPLHYYAGADKDSGVVTFETPTLEIRPPPDMINMPEDRYKIVLFNVFDEEEWIYKMDFHTDISVSRLPECFVTDQETGETYYDSECDPTPSYIDTKEDYKIINVPYSSIGKKIEIFGPGDKQLAVVPLDKFMDFCGDGKCSDTESYLTCPIECMDTEIKLKMNPGDETAEDTNNEFGQVFRQTHFNSNIEISSNEIASVYVEKGKCANNLFICIESPEEDDIGVYFPKNSQTGKTRIITLDQLGNQNAGLMAANGLGLRVSGDWPNNPKTTSTMSLNGRRCTQTFNPNVQPPISQTCT